MTSSIQLKLCLAAASGLRSWGLALFGLVILSLLCATGADVTGAGLAAVASHPAVGVVADAVGRGLQAVVSATPVVTATVVAGGVAMVGIAVLAVSDSRKSHKAKAGTFPRRPRAGFQRSVPCKPLGVAGDSPSSSSSKPSASSRTNPLPNQHPSYYEDLMQYGSRPRRSLVRCFCLGCSCGVAGSSSRAWAKFSRRPVFRRDGKSVSAQPAAPSVAVGVPLSVGR